MFSNIFTNKTIWKTNLAKGFQTLLEKKNELWDRKKCKKDFQLLNIKSSQQIERKLFSVLL